MRPTLPATAALIGSAVLLAGCSSAVAGTAGAADPAPALLGSVDLAEVDDELGVHDVAATPGGSFVALMTGSVLGVTDSPGGALVELVPGEDGLTVGTVTPAAPYVGGGLGSAVHVAGDGTLVAVGSVLSGDGSDEDQWDVALSVLAPGAEEVRVVPVAADPVHGTPDTSTSVLSADGRTLYAALHWDGADGDRLAAIDVATGAVLATAEVQVTSPGGVSPDELALRPDGGVVALVQATREAGGRESGVLVAEYDAGLALVGQPVEVVPDRPRSNGHALAVLDDGTAVVSVSSGGGDHRLVTVRDGAVQESHALPGIAGDLAVAPGGQQVRVNVNLAEEVVGVATVDLATGEVSDEVELCAEEGSPADVALSADGAAVVALASCRGTDDADTSPYLVG